jgi:glutaredoxin
MHRSIAFALILLLWSGVPSIGFAAESRLAVYIFGSEDCSFCRNARAFLRKISKENGGFDLHEYDVVRSGDDAALLVRFITAVGMQEAHIPMVVIGRQIMLGYDNDATSGREMRRQIEQCRVQTCDDVVRQFIDRTGPEYVAAQLVQNRRWIAASLRKSQRSLAKVGAPRP